MTQLRKLGNNVSEVETGDRVILFSYDNPIAVRMAGRIYITIKRWSQTTSTHLHEWISARNGAVLIQVSQEEINRLAAGGAVTK